MRFGDFLGLGALPGRLEREFGAGRFVNAYLFCGPEGTGKAEMAALCARALNCAGAHKPCDRCPSCLRALSGTHPDIVHLRPDGRGIPVDDVRGLIAQVAVRPFEGGHRAVVVHGADRMTPQAQNALLKTLESGPESCVFILLAGAPSKLLKTVLSRCRIVRFHPIDLALCADALERRGIARERAAALSAAAGGSVGRALALDGDAGYWALRERIVRALRALPEPGGACEAAFLLKDDKDAAQDALEILEGIGRALLLRDVGLRCDPSLSGIGVPGDALLAAALAARERLQSNVVWIHVVEHLFMALGR